MSLLTSPIDFAPRVPADVRFICETLRAAGWRAWIVGGCTRDMLLGRELHDWDLTTNARPEDVSRLFHRVIPTGIAHGTVTVLLRGVGYEVTTLRGDGTYSDGRHPDSVMFVDDLEQDLARRDFTVNAIAFDPFDGSLTDPFGGRRDLEARLIRAVGVAHDRFQEDGLRILRAARFAATLGFALDLETARAMTSSVERLRCVSSERVRDELFKTLGAEKPSVGLRIMQSTGCLAEVLPEAIATVGCEQNRYHSFDVWEHTLHALDACRSDLAVRLAILFHDLGKPSVRAKSEKTQDYTFYEHEVVGAEIAQQIGMRLRFPGALRQRVVHLVRHHLILYDPSWSASAIRRWIQRVGAEHVCDLLEMARADAVGKGETACAKFEELAHLQRRLEEHSADEMALSIRDLVVNGGDLMAEVGLAPGRIVGEVLRHLLELVVEDPSMNCRDLLLDAARSYLVAAQKSADATTSKSV